MMFIMTDLYPTSSYQENCPKCAEKTFGKFFVRSFNSEGIGACIKLSHHKRGFSISSRTMEANTLY